jgi:hypothetical protein
MTECWSLRRLQGVKASTVGEVEVDGGRGGQRLAQWLWTDEVAG